MNGEQLRIGAAGYEAHIAAVGGALRTLTHGGRDLVVGFAATEARPLHRGVIAVPWPNRIADGRYAFGGESHQLPVSEPARRTALHGLTLWTPWQVRDRTSAGVVLTHELSARAGYPFTLALELVYTVGADGLAVQLTAANTGSEPAPYGCTFHPYLRAGDGLVDDWTLEARAGSYLEVDDRGLPVRLRTVAGTPFDFRAPRRIGATAVDHAFTDLDDAARRVRVRDAEGRGVEMGWDAACRWVQLFTSDQEDGPHHRTGIAVEPMTCPPDAFRTGVDLVVLEPGATHQVRWTIRALPG